MSRRVSMSTRAFRRMLDELARRGRGERESGAFLLGRIADRREPPDFWPVHRVVYYDDLDAKCLTGGITFTEFAALWANCKLDNSTVIADVHTHPSRWVGQSSIDAENPMIATVGHVALIAPDYAKGRPQLDSIGVFTHLGGHRWREGGQAFVLIGPFTAIAAALRRWAGRVLR